MQASFFNRAIGFAVSILISVTFIPSLYAQEPEQNKEWKDGELEDVHIEIVKERQITLPKANRNFEKIPPRASEPIKPPITYDFRAFSFQAPGINPPIRPLRLKQENISGVYGSYLSAGYGSYATPYAEAFLNSGRDKNKLVGAHGWYRRSGRGPVDGRNSGSGTSGLSLYGKTFGEYISLSAKAGYENYSTHFYGYPAGEIVDRSSIKQAYNVFSLGGSVSNTRNSDFSYSLGGNFSHLADKYRAREAEVDLHFGSSYKMDDESSIGIKADYFIISRKDEAVEAKPRNLFLVNGFYSFVPIEGLKLSAGLSIAYENDTLDNKNLHVFPDIRGSYAISPSVDIVGSLTGGVDKVSLQTLSRENQWLGANIPLYHTNRLMEFTAGINARLGNKVEVQSGISAADLRNFYYFLNDEQDQSIFTPVYDRGVTKRSNFYASLSYAQSEKAKFMIRGDLYSYLVGEFAEAWHRPTYRLSANASLNVYDKIFIKTDMILQGGMRAFDHQTSSVVKLDGAVDLNVRGEYIFSPGFSFFVELNNLTSNKYPLFYHYPVRGMQVLGGITWSF